MASTFSKITVLSIFITAAAVGQIKAQTTEPHQAVRAVLETFFEGMQTGDTTKIKTTIAENLVLQTTFTNKSGKPVRVAEDFSDFLNTVAQAQAGDLDEQLWTYEIKIDEQLATVWTDYTFFYKGKMSHCGVNVFQLFKDEAGWRIFSIVDTRRRTNCQTAPTEPLDSFLNAWHRAAATADADGFFGRMSQTGIYIGTDASERWLRDELRTWAAKAFERPVAWDFKPIERQIFYSEDGRLAWFNETLDTWMGVCRSSGVVRQSNGGWLMEQYHLSVTVPNDAIREFIELVKKY